MTNDGGDNWTRLTGHGLPPSPLGKIAVSFAPSDGRRVYALIETGQGGTLWRSDDGGDDWKVVNYSRLLNERPHYYTRMLVMPDNENEVYFPSNGISATFDGGETTDHMQCPGDDPAAKAGGRGRGECGGDNHDMWSDPKNPARMMIGSDGGVLISTERGREWHLIRLPIAQMYHVATDNRIPYMVLRANAGWHAAARTQRCPRRRRDRRRRMDDDGRLRDGLEHARSGRQQHRLGRLLRGRDRALRRAQRLRAVGERAGRIAPWAPMRAR